VAVLLERALQMERLVDDLFQWARWDWGQPQLQNQTLDLAEQVSLAVTRWAADWPTLRVEWTAPAMPVAVCADPMALRRIFDNLARNAVQHAGSKPSLHLSLEGTEVLTLRFRDEGPGIAPEFLGKVFERFFRGDPARNPSWGGGGLGLTISRTLAEAHGGTLTADNASTGGAVFTLTLPAPTSC
jgi:signal transduction histidine kinase